MNRLLLTDLSLSLPGDMLHKVDTASMAYSLEVREPFLDPAVVEYASRLPTRYKLERRDRKRVLIDAHRDLLPAGIAERPKMGFEVPIGEFLRNELREMFFDVVDRPTVDSFGWLDYDAISSLYDAHRRHAARDVEHHLDVDPLGEALLSRHAIGWYGHGPAGAVDRGQLGPFERELHLHDGCMHGVDG